MGHIQNFVEYFGMWNGPKRHPCHENENSSSHLTQLSRHTAPFHLKGPLVVEDTKKKGIADIMYMEVEKLVYYYYIFLEVITTVFVLNPYTHEGENDTIQLWSKFWHI